MKIISFIFILVFGNFATAQFSNDTIINGKNYGLYDTIYAYQNYSGTDSTIIVYMESAGLKKDQGQIVGVYESGGNLYCEGQMKDGQFYKHVITYYTNGITESNRVYEKGGNVKNRVWSDTIINGENYYIYEYINSFADSSVIIFLETDVYRKGTGKIFGIYENSGLPYCIGEMKKGAYCNHWISWHVNGQVESEGYFSKNGNTKWDNNVVYQDYFETELSGVRNGYWSWYYDNGNIKTEGNFHRKGIRLGTWKSYFETGNQMIQIGYDNFVCIALNYGRGIAYCADPLYYYEYYPDGKTKFEILYDGSDYSFITAYYDNGAVYFFENYEEDTLAYYCRDGFIYWSGNMEDQESYEIPAEDTLCNQEEIDQFVEPEQECWPRIKRYQARW